MVLVNNMPDAAFEATEHQFGGLVHEAAGESAIVRLTSLPNPRRGPSVRARLAERYEDLASVRARPPDAVIVTGSEPRCSDLRDEATWGHLVALLAWAEEATTSVLLSCLAAHGAVLATDGIERRRLPAKLSGVYRQSVRPDHRLTTGVGPLAIPHSRLHEVDPAELEARGYRILVASAEAGWTLAARDGCCLRVLVQGHPEYDPTTLLREYRRDVRRYLAGEATGYPAMPAGYLDGEAVALLEAFAAEAAAEAGDPGLADRFPYAACAARVLPRWHDPAVRLFSNWLGEVRSRKLAGTHRRAG